MAIQNIPTDTWTPIPPLPNPLPMRYLPDHEPSTSTTPYLEPHPKTLLDMQNREGEDYGRRQGYSTNMPDSFTSRFPNRLEAGTTNMNQFHDTQAPFPLPLPQA